MKRVKGNLILAVLGAALVMNTAFVGATAVNPYTNTAPLYTQGAQKAAYIQEKTDGIFAPQTSPSSPATSGYDVPTGWKQEKLMLNGVSVEKYTPANVQTDRVVLFLHGGGYVGGLHNRYRDWGIHQGEIAGNATVLMVDYRIAPANTYPAALDDAVAAYKGLLKEGYDPDKIVLVGDSAGGNLAAALAVYARDHQLALPKVMVLISPWTYVGEDLPSHKTNLKKDQILGEKNKRLAGELKTPSYAKGADRTNPYLSPAYADLTGLPPMLITVGGDELLFDDGVLLGAHAQAAGVEAKTVIYPGMSHDWTILLPELPETRALEGEMSQFINKYLS